MVDITELTDTDGLIHVYYWGNEKPESYPPSYGAHQYKDLPWSICVDGTDGRDVTPDSVYYGLGSDSSNDSASIAETKAAELEIAVANGRVDGTHTFKMEMTLDGLVTTEYSPALDPGQWHIFKVALDKPVSVDIYKEEEDPRFKLRYKGG